MNMVTLLKIITTFAMVVVGVGCSTYKHGEGITSFRKQGTVYHIAVEKNAVGRYQIILDVASSDTVFNITAIDLGKGGQSLNRECIIVKSAVKRAVGLVGDRYTLIQGDAVIFPRKVVEFSSTSEPLLLKVGRFDLYGGKEVQIPDSSSFYDGTGVYDKAGRPVSPWK